MKLLAKADVVLALGTRLGPLRAATIDILHRLQTGNTQLTAHQNKSERLREIKHQREVREGELNHRGQTDCAIEKALPVGAMVTTDIGNICSVSNSYLRFEHPDSFFAALSLGNCGYAFATAIGARSFDQSGRQSPMADGAWGMSLQETLTCVRKNIPVNRHCLQQRAMGR
jgi:sulfoacetaldehyde acetyltransferase